MQLMILSATSDFESFHYPFLLGMGMFILACFCFAWFAANIFLRYHKQKNKHYVSDTMLNADVAYFFEIGKRERQEDSVFISPLDQYGKHGIIACVSDGMGGLKYGDDISRRIIHYVDKAYPVKFSDNDRTAELIRKMSNKLFYKYHRTGGATLALVHIYNNKLHFYSVGDSNVILIRNGKSTVLNIKQNYSGILAVKYAKQGMTTEKAYTDSDSRALVDFIGNSNPRVHYSADPIMLMDSDILVICSDGVTDIINEDDLPDYVGNNARITADNIKREIRITNNPKQDNYSGIVIRLNVGTVI